MKSFEWIEIVIFYRFRWNANQSSGYQAWETVSNTQVGFFGLLRLFFEILLQD